MPLRIPHTKSKHAQAKSVLELAVPVKKIGGLVILQITGSAGVPRECTAVGGRIPGQVLSPFIENKSIEHHIYNSSQDAA